MRRAVAVLATAVASAAVAGSLAGACSSPAPVAACEGGVCDAGAADVAADRAGRWHPPPGPWLSGWSRVKWAPDCELYEPSSPEGWASIPPLSWKPCGSGRAGCERLDRDWTGWNDAWAFRGRAADYAGHGFLSLARSYESKPYRQETLLLRDEVVVAAWRLVGSCMGMMSGVMSSTRLAEAYVPIADASSGVSDTWLLPGDLANPEAMIGASTAIHLTADQLGVIGNIAMVEEATPDVLALWIDSVSRGAVFDRVSEKVAALSGSVSDQMGAVGDAVVFSVWDWQNKKGTIESWTRKFGQVTLVDRGPGVYAHSVATDGVRMLWTEGSNMTQDGPFATSVVYESPFTTDPQKVVPVVLFGNGCRGWGCGSRIQAGYAILNTTPIGSSNGEESYALIRFADHARWYLQAVKGKDAWNQIPTIAGGKLYMPGIDLTMSVRTRGLQRIDLSALGAPETD